VTALVRSDARATALLARVAASPGKLETRIGHVNDRASLDAAMVGCDAVVHLVALPRDCNDGADLERVNAVGTATMIAAAEAARITRFIHLGALGVQERPELHYASSKARGEGFVRASTLDWTILKPSLIWGERDGFFNIVAALVKIPAPAVPVPGSGKSRFQPVWVGDVARAIVLVLDAPKGSIKASFELGGHGTGPTPKSPVKWRVHLGSAASSFQCQFR